MTLSRKMVGTVWEVMVVVVEVLQGAHGQPKNKVIQPEYIRTSTCEAWRLQRRQIEGGMVESYLNPSRGTVSYTYDR
jgi:hypothetical protein